MRSKSIQETHEMQPTNTPKAPPAQPSSFINHEKLEQQIEENRAKSAKQVEAEQEKAPEAAKPLTPEDEAKVAKEKKFYELKEALEKDLEVTITEENARDLIFKGRLRKEVVILKSGVLGTVKGTFQSLTPSEIREIDGKLAAFIKKPEGSFTEQGVIDERSLLYLSYGWLQASGRNIGNTPDERRQTINDMSGTLIGAATTSWNALDNLIQLTVNEGKFLKK